DYPAKQESATNRSHCGAGCLPNCGNKGDGCEGTDEELSRENSGPDAIAIEQNCGKSNPKRRPYWADIAAPDVSSGLAELSGNQISQQNKYKLGYVLPGVLFVSCVTHGFSMPSWA